MRKFLHLVHDWLRTWPRCYWFQNHKWRTLWEFRTMTPVGFVCTRCGRQTCDLMSTFYQGKVKGWML